MLNHILALSRQPSRRALSTISQTKIKTLPSGIKLVVDETPSHFSAVGLYVNAGSRFEDRYDLTGCSHLMDKMAYRSTTEMSGAEMVEKLNHLGGNYMCASSRETLIYQASVFNQDVDKMFKLLSDTIARPALLDEEINEQISNARYELNELWLQSDMILPELLQQTAYSGKNLGCPLLCPQEELDKVTSAKLRQYRDLFYRPDRLVVAMSGVPFEKAEELTLKNLEDFKARNSTEIIKDPAVYTGGEFSTPYPEELAYMGQEFHHIHVGFEGVPIQDEEVYKLATLQMLIGGGGSFSAGGPGKGMYSRAYTRILNQYGFVESCKSFIHNFSDSGLFGISLSCIPQANRVMGELIGFELSLLMEDNVRNGGITDSEVERSKNQLKSSLMMNLESKMVQLEDMGRQVQIYGKRVDVLEMCEKIDRITRHDLIDIAKRVLTGSKPTIVIQGDRDSFGDVAETLAKSGLGTDKKTKKGWFV
ncbi:hypothetical protein KL918_001734 [Ogataea parapolymorpha]|uniref:Mitochondrial-processing peptidase subunit alpha n=1 Tax=Ogataea parapolymorpha (strain ATCC 26012 / BCRC 20466 / JCM 22074 / NRRL Y-7560 / DL-1) TaxID=871575 RepID=W1QG53_OGAPD|nr:Mitochondrial-processing peptidase subunit alpha [Ogataea parapolymorpha DL-1]ESW98873.1 Mitochondrial-processing peptidase subunit alpha [Ogataea parapolymorpha DL-1]KAG7868076.1 hypothetical protein KL918_001734 [Ogataea parapolymorpha]KAG7874304.1 hypothetical protein KL916_001644 [Ogataea parapolymorpha]